MELITNWEIFNEVNLAFCQFQGLLGIIVITGIAIFQHNLGAAVIHLFSPDAMKGGEANQ